MVILNGYQGKSCQPILALMPPDHTPFNWQTKGLLSHNRSMIRPNQTSYDLHKATEVCIDAKATPHPIRNDINQVSKSKTEIKLKTVTLRVMDL